MTSFNFQDASKHIRCPRAARLFRDPIHNGAEWSWECSLCGAVLRGHASRTDAIQSFEAHLAAEHPACSYCADRPESSLIRCRRCDVVVCQQCAYNHIDHPTEWADDRQQPHVFVVRTTP